MAPGTLKAYRNGLSSGTLSIQPSGANLWCNRCSTPRNTGHRKEKSNYARKIQDGAIFTSTFGEKSHNVLLPIMKWGWVENLVEIWLF